MNETCKNVLCLLSESWRFSDTADPWPRLYTQKGIAQAVGKAWPTIRKTVAELELQGFISRPERRQRVNGEIRTVWVYIITRAGRDEVERIRFDYARTGAREVYKRRSV